MGWWYYRGFYPRSVPRRAKGGIKAQSRRGAFGETWWARRWIQVLESFEIGARLGRGRSYARGGQVLNVDIQKGRVTAKVQGSQRRPYSIIIKLKPLSAADWTKAAAALSREALFAAKLLAGQMPPDIESVFTRVGVALFPKRHADLHTECSCPDWSNPCKHIAAVYYLLGEEFDRDPFLIFRLRGITREEFLALLGGSKAAKGSKKKARPAAAEAVTERPAPVPAPLPAEPAVFWGSNAPAAPEPLGDVRVPAVPGALVKALGVFPFWRSTEPFLDSMADIYTAASARGIQLLLAERRP